MPRLTLRWMLVPFYLEGVGLKPFCSRWAMGVMSSVSVRFSEREP